VRYDRTEAYVAAVADVEVNPADGQVRVTRVVVAHDCGLIILKTAVSEERIA